MHILQSVLIIFSLDGPELREPESETFAVLQNTDVTLICGTNLDGNPKPSIRWFSNIGTEIDQDNSNFSINSGPELVSLTIFNTTLSNTGTWNCVISALVPNETENQQINRRLALSILGEKMIIDRLIIMTIII